MISANVDAIWKEENLSPFDEIIISWNGQRLDEKTIEILVKVLIDEKWTDWFLYSSWGPDFQKSCHFKTDSVSVYQDAIVILDGKKATGFIIKTNSFLRMHVYTNGKKDSKKIYCEKPIYLWVDGLSQMTLNHTRHRDLCSPTSTTAVLRYLLKKEIDPISFANAVFDHEFDIFGNWVLNVAEGSRYLGLGWDAWVERLDCFEEIYDRLLKNTPVIVSVRGPLPGSALPYATGHLLVVTGFDPMTRAVHCMDPAFERDETTQVQYELDGFLTAWSRRGKLAYIFEKRVV